MDGQTIKIIINGCAALETALTSLDIATLTALGRYLKHGLRP